MKNSDIPNDLLCQTDIVDLRNYTTIRIGGTAKKFFSVHNTEALNCVVNNCDGCFYILGGGSNILIKDSIIDTPIIKLGDEFSYIWKKDEYVEAGAATPFSCVLNYMIKNNLSGIENLAGIPATIGGMIVMNASAFGNEISSSVDMLEVMERKGGLKRLKRNDICFGYRTSSLKDKIVLRVWLRLKKAQDIKAKVKDYLKRRYSRGDFSAPSCGCIFKNPQQGAAGFFIDQCGLKGVKRNDAQISSQHANFIVNCGHAAYDDVDYLIKLMKEKVYNKFNIMLEEEIVRWI